MNNKNIIEKDRNAFVFYKPNSSEVDKIVGLPLTNWKEIIKRFVKNPTAIISLALFLLILFMAIIIPSISDFSSNTQVYDGKADLNILKDSGPYSGANWSASLVANSDFLSDLDSKNIPYTKVGDPYIEGSQLIKININNYLALIKDSNGNSLKPVKPILGLNQDGIDIWTMTWTGLRRSMLISLLVSLISITIGVALGAYIGFHAGKKLDTYAMRFIDIYNSIPLILLAILFSSIIGGSVAGTILLFLILTIFNPVAVTRDLVMRVKDTEFLLASKSIGASKRKIIIKGVLPLIIGRLLSSVIFVFTSIIFMESTLALLGIIKSNDYVTFGTVIDNARTNMDNLIFLLFPASLLLILSLSLRFISVGVNDAFNVRLNRGK